MIKIIILSPGISINGNIYPNNSVTFEIIDKTIDEIEIKNSHGKTLHKSVYTDFVNSNSLPFASAQAVIDELLLSYS